MKMKISLLLCLILMLSACSKEEVEFPSLENKIPQSSQKFKTLFKTMDPELFHQLNGELISDVEEWEEEILRLQQELADNSQVSKDLNKSVLRAYAFIVSEHVNSYIFRDEILNPENYRIQEEILEDLDELQLALNHFMIQIYPIRDVDLAFYKNLPEITSRTSDSHANLYYIIKVNVGYLREEKQTQTALNNSKKVMEDMIRSYCSLHTENELLGWNEVVLKAGMMKVLNDYIAQFYDFKQGKMEGVKNLTFSKIQTFPFN